MLRLRISSTSLRLLQVVENILKPYGFSRKEKRLRKEKPPKKPKEPKEPKAKAKQAAAAAAARGERERKIECVR